MKNLTGKLMLLSVIALSLTTSSCFRQTGCTDPNALNYSAAADIEDGSCIYGGCTDPDSKNYDPTADVDDGSCEFEGSYVFWYGESVAANLAYYDVVSLTYYVDGEIVGSSAASVYWTGAPDCGQNGSVTVDMELGNVKTRSATFSVKDQDNYVIWEGLLNFEANTCIRLELVWSKKSVNYHP